MDNNEYHRAVKKYNGKIAVDRIYCGEYDTLSPHNSTLHRHVYNQLVWIKEGNGEHLVEGHKYTYSEGSLFLLAPHFMHQITYNKDVEGYVVSFCDTLLDRFQNESTLLFHTVEQCHIKIPKEEQNLLNSEFEHLYHYVKQPDRLGKNIIIQNYLHIILTKINAFSRLKQSKERNVDGPYLKLLERFVLLIRGHFKEEKQLPYYLDKLAVSQRKLNDVVKEVTGLPPAKFLELFILNEAARMLRYSDYSIKEIAMELGYTDSSYFAKAFKKQFKRTPLEYRAAASDTLNAE